MTSTSESTACPVLHADPFEDRILENPNDFHRELRDAGPAAYLPSLDVFALGRYQEVRAVLADWRSFESGAGVGLSNFRREQTWRPPSLLLEADPPRHDAPRSVLTAILGPRALRLLRDDWLADARLLIDELADRRSVDAVTDIARVFPLRVFPDAVGIGIGGRENLLPYGDHVFNAFGPRNALVANGMPRAAELSEWVMAQCQRDNLAAFLPSGQPTFGSQIWRAADRGDITTEQAPLVVRSLLSAGVDTTVLGIAAVLFGAASNPTAWQQMRADPSLARRAFEEAIRWESPVQTFFRTATRDIRIGSAVVRAGTKILMFLGSANRDPHRWANPDLFDVQRDPSGHVGFGMGIHQCVGQHVARLEAEALLTAMLDRFERIEFDGRPRRHLNNTLRAFESLPLTLMPR